jgi:hypothetical protein
MGADAFDHLTRALQSGEAANGDELILALVQKIRRAQKAMMLRYQLYP